MEGAGGEFVAAQWQDANSGLEQKSQKNREVHNSDDKKEGDYEDVDLLASAWTSAKQTTTGRLAAAPDDSLCEAIDFEKTQGGKGQANGKGRKSVSK